MNITIGLETIYNNNDNNYDKNNSRQRGMI